MMSNHVLHPVTYSRPGANVAYLDDNHPARKFRARDRTACSAAPVAPAGAKETLPVLKKKGICAMRTGQPGSLQYCKLLPVSTRHHPFFRLGLETSLRKTPQPQQLITQSVCPQFPLMPSNKKNVADDTAPGGQNDPPPTRYTHLFLAPPLNGAKN
ncbi:unnamed protein product, partial [Ectocarpus sp. 13 AM-2016]